MIVPPGPLRVLVATRPVDFRKGMDGLAGFVKPWHCRESERKAHYVTSLADRVKLLMWDGSGLVLVSKRLGEGKFRWPRVEDGVMRLSPGQLTALLEGLDWTRVHARRVRTPLAVQ